MGSIFTIGLSLILIGAGVYAIMIGKNWLPKGKGQNSKEDSEESDGNKIQYIIAGIILVYFGISNLYTLFV